MPKSFLKITTTLIIVLLCSSLQTYSQMKSIPNYSENPRSEVPAEYTWKIEDIYSSMDEWQKDIQAVTDMLNQVETKSKTWTQSAENFYNMLKFEEDMNLKMDRLGSYCSLQHDMDMANSTFTQMLGQIQQIYVQKSTKFTFMNNDLLKMDEKVLWSYFEKEPKLEPFRHDIQNTLRNKSHILPEDQEKLLSMIGLFGSTPSQASGLLRDVDMPAPEITLSDGSKVILNTSNFSFYRTSKNPADRTLVMSTFFGNYKKYENTFAALLDGALKQRLFGIKTRNYGSCLQSRLFSDNIDTSVYYTLVKNVRENLAPLHRFLKLKKELLGLEKFRYEDVYASAVKQVDKLYTFDEAKEIVLKAMSPLGDEYVKNLAKAFDNKWIDIYPNKGKQTGAYSGGIYGVHPYVKMNYNGNYNAVSTLAHELGHAMHSYNANATQTYSNAGYSLFLAEIASTFNENLLMDYMLKNETDDMFKLYILDNYLDGARGTIYRQTLFAEFELAMHQHVEEGKSLTPDFLNKTYLDITKKYYGSDEGVTEVGDYIQNEWSFIPHFYRAFYVYQYSTGMLASMFLANNVVTKGGEFTEKYLTMLKSGGSDYSLELLKKAGVDMTTDQPYISGLSRFDNYVAEMEKIVERLKKAGKL